VTDVCIICAHCGRRRNKPSGAVTRSRKIGAPLYCNRRCAGLGHRCGKTKAQRVKEKAAYDAEYRETNLDMLKSKKADYFKRTYDPVAAAVERKKHMARHVEYCRQPEYRAKKTIYDKQHRAKKQFGPFAEVAMLTIDLNRAIKERTSNYEIRQQNKTRNKKQTRAREEQEESRGRPRQRGGSDDHRASHG
jgi:hypothetical protein